MKDKINISIDKNLLLKLDLLAKHEGRTRSNMIERIIDKEITSQAEKSTDKTEV